MISRKEHETLQVRARELLRRSGLALRAEELAGVEVLDFGLGMAGELGLQVVPVLETGQLAIRLVALLAGQTCPEHRHPPQGDYAGKEETLRCAWGRLYVCTEGEPTERPQAAAPPRWQHFTVWRETALAPGDQLSLPPDMLHWFQGGPEGAVAWLFCSRATDAEDVFTDPDVRRMAPVVGEGADQGEGDG